jgi:hypothetical protein
VSSLRSVRQRRTVTALAAGVAAAVLLGVFSFAGARTLLNSKEGRPANTLPDATRLPPTPAALLAVVDRNDGLVGLDMLALAPPGVDGVARGGTVIPIPVGSGLVSGDSPEMHRLADTYAAEGLDGLVNAASTLLSVNFSVVAAVGEQALSDLLAPAAPIPIDLTADVVDTTSHPDDESEQDEVVLPAGIHQLSPADAATLLTAVRSGEIEERRFDLVSLFWYAVSDRVGNGLPVTVGADPQTGIHNFMASLLGGPLRVYPLRGEPVRSATANPRRLDMYQLNNAEIIRVMATVVPNAISPIDLAFTVQIVNPTGDTSLTQAAVERLAIGGAAVVLIRELRGVSVPAVTEFSLSGRASLDEVKPYADSLGQTVQVPLAEPGLPHGRVVGIDATFVLGRSFGSLVARQSTTTVPPVTSNAPPTTDVAGATSSAPSNLSTDAA